MDQQDTMSESYEIKNECSTIAEHIIEIKEEGMPEDVPQSCKKRRKFDLEFRTDGFFQGDNWRCSKCKQGTLFSSLFDLICHIMKEHQNTLIFQCNICSVFVKDTGLAEHFTNHKMIGLSLLNRPTTCADDDTEFKEEFADDALIGQSSDDDSEDNVPLRSLIRTQPHINNEAQLFGNSRFRDKFKCNECDDEFETLEDCSDHVANNHDSNSKPDHKLTKIKNKNKRQSCKDMLGKVGKQKKGHLCSYCGKTFSLSYKLKMHYRIHTGEKPYSCSQCDKTFSIVSNLKRHIMIHTGEKPYLCTICGKSFNQLTSFKTHSSIHAGAKPHVKRSPQIKPTVKYSCMYCNKEFSTRGTLKIHIRMHTKERPYQCGTCSKTFAQKVSLTQHLLNHTGEKPHQCPYCLKSFKLLVCLKIHLRTHTGERPYKCGDCDRAFATQSNLYRHRSTHTGIKRFSCDYCSKEFSQRTALGDHINVHTGARPYSCPHCVSSFANQSTLCKHVSKHLAKDTAIK